MIYSEMENPVTHEQTVVRSTPLDFSRMLYMLYLEIDATIKHADTKAQLVMSAGLLLVSALATSIDPDDVQLMLAGQVTPLEVAGQILTFATAFCLFASILFGLNVVVPRIMTTGNTFFFGHIATLSASRYIDEFMDMSLHEVKEAVLVQIHAKSVIAMKKLVNVNRCITFIFIAVVLWALSRVMFALG